MKDIVYYTLEGQYTAAVGSNPRGMWTFPVTLPRGNGMLDYFAALLAFTDGSVNDLIYGPWGIEFTDVNPQGGVMESGTVTQSSGTAWTVTSQNDLNNRIWLCQHGQGQLPLTDLGIVLNNPTFNVLYQFVPLQSIASGDVLRAYITLGITYGNS